MRIGLVITELDPGGAELCLTELALYLKSRAHPVMVWSLGPPPRGSQAILLERLTLAGIDVQFGNARGTRDAWRIARWLRRSFDQFRPDIVQSMLWHANVISGWALWTRTTPWVAGMRVSEPRSGRWWLERLVSRRMQHLVCVSQDVGQHAVHQQRLPAELISVIPNGIKPPQMSSAAPESRPSLAQLGLPVSQPALLFVGRLEAQKGLHSLVDHLPDIMRRLPQWHMIFVGQGSLEPMLRARIASAGLNDRVHLVGWQANVLQWMQASQMLVLPAAYEGMPNVVLEAMSVARPFIAFAVDGVGQLVSPSDGYPSELAAAQTAEPNNWTQFAQRIETLASSDQLQTQCGQANQLHVSQHFQLDHQLRKYEELYARLISNFNSHPAG